MDFSGKQIVDIFEKWIHFLILLIILENETSLPSGEAFAPRTPCGGRVIAFKCPGRSPQKIILATRLSLIILSPFL